MLDGSQVRRWGIRPFGILIKVMQGCEDAGDEEDWEITALYGTVFRESDMYV